MKTIGTINFQKSSIKGTEEMKNLMKKNWKKNGIINFQKSSITGTEKMKKFVKFHRKIVNFTIFYNINQKFSKSCIKENIVIFLKKSQKFEIFKSKISKNILLQARNKWKFCKVSWKNYSLFEKATKNLNENFQKSSITGEEKIKKWKVF